jgi:hypothetical protein
LLVETAVPGVQATSAKYCRVPITCSRLGCIEHHTNTNLVAKIKSQTRTNNSKLCSRNRTLASPLYPSCASSQHPLLHQPRSTDQRATVSSTLEHPRGEREKKNC